MSFQLIPVVDQMLELYRLPIGQDRFQAYLNLLQGPHGKDMICPVGGYNPMAKEPAIARLQELKMLNAEALAQTELEKLSRECAQLGIDQVGVALNLADDVGGSWSDYFSTSFSSRFQIGALVKRQFCAVFFWTSEPFSEELIRRRVREYALRTVYQLRNGLARTLQDMMDQERFVAQHSPKTESQMSDEASDLAEKFLKKYGNSDEMPVMFNFFMGDEASEALGYRTFGLEPNLGFRYAQKLAIQA
ncbi:hypothetical protein [Pontibacter sp. G13]|uniref:hypothetical protein n=1 Tax=Pontibacter sp. G13 TaxID=3074898 RepID=UPI00288B55E6|nr:hypothetical protein [Pontibacter sp. G13]WNJ18321.1 hypothetical protein RJD25_26000 [Pontibacter sp. G13]